MSSNDSEKIDLNNSAENELSIKEKLNLLPKEPGVYIFRDIHKKIIYIGKAKILRNRVRSYFSGRDDGRAQYPQLVARIHDLETIVTDTEVAALVLEATLIRRHRPKYNIDMRDDKSYPYLKVTKEPFPRIFLTRQPKEDKSKYYGPLTEVTQARDTIDALKKACTIRSCNLKITKTSIKQKKHKLCLEYHIGNCMGPCVGLQSESEYSDSVNLMVDSIYGRGAKLIEMLNQRMKKYSSGLHFEEAAKVRDQIERTKNMAVRKKIISKDTLNRDIFGIAQEDNYGCIVVIKVREARVVGRSFTHLSRLTGVTRASVWANFLVDYYLSETRMVPNELILPDDLDKDDEKLLLEYLKETRGRKINLTRPVRGERVKLMDLATHNAELLLAERLEAKKKSERIPHSLQMLQEHLNLEKIPKIIECFDNSNLFGQFPVASMVQFKDARPNKGQYRHYKIKTVVGIDDFASMKEIVGRRYSRLVSEKADLPDLVLIDGGIGQVNAAKRILDSLGLQEVMVIGLAKRLEEIVFPFSTETITLPKTSSALKLLMHLRDEAHRFAITFHRKLRGDAQVSSTLESLGGIGKSKARVLLKHFGSLKRLKNASIEDIGQVEGFSNISAKKLFDQLAEKS
jgi:excinuclease ABC subunit C